MVKLLLQDPRINPNQYEAVRYAFKQGYLEVIDVVIEDDRFDIVPLPELFDFVVLEKQRAWAAHFCMKNMKEAWPDIVSIYLERCGRIWF